MLSRRRFLTGLAATGALGGAGLLAGCTVPDMPRPRSSAQCVDRDTLPSVTAIGGAALHYEVDGRRRPFFIDPGFRDQVRAWLQDWQEASGRGSDRLDTYGTWINGRGTCDSWHHSGRALDIARLRAGRDTVVSCREDRWAETAEAADARRRYWALAAHLHIHFAYVLTYLFDDRHRNHIHIDNGRSGSSLSTFRAGSRVQVQAVQATARWLFDEPVEITGRWDTATRRASDAVLQAVGRNRDLTSSDNWHAYLRACVARQRT